MRPTHADTLAPTGCISTLLGTSLFFAIYFLQFVLFRQNVIKYWISLGDVTGLLADDALADDAVEVTSLLNTSCFSPYGQCVTGDQSITNLYPIYKLDCKIPE